MNAYETKWVQGTIVIDALFASDEVETKLIRATDYVLLQMMGKIAHRTELLPVPKELPKWPNYKGGPFKH